MLAAHGARPDLRTRRFRASLSRFTTGVTVVTFEGPTGPHGFTVNSFTSVSLEPPLILVSVARTAWAHAALAGRTFTVNVLGAEQRALAEHFAGAKQVQPVWLEDKAPRLAGVVAHFVCEPWASYDGGDHTLYLGKVVDFDYRRGDLLGFSRGMYVNISDPDQGIEELM